ncbi:MAG: V-type ATP synthase subunit A [Azospirillaceae bacterium]
MTTPSPPPEGAAVTGGAEGRETPDARVVGVRENLVTIETRDRPVMKNGVAFVSVGREGGERRLEAEVLRIRGTLADLQVYEDTAGVAVGDAVYLTGEMLSVTLGPGLLGQVYDGLQNPLAVLAREYGYFLPRGVYADPLDRSRKWAFEPSARVGDVLGPGAPLGTVKEGRFAHKIMVPFGEPGPVEVTWIQGGSFTVDTPVARIRPAPEDGADARDAAEREITMVQRWPVRRALPERLLRARRAERLFPDEPLVTTIRLIDTFFPIARGGTACIPGPFGAGKTVLQNLISRYSAVDVVIVVACGERAGEVVETITEFPQLRDPKTGGSLMDRTIIVCNTSAMPVAARESSIYTGITLGEYYRQMGFDVLVIADSTSRWAQAMRETSGRMEEIPGEEAFPAYLDSAIKGVYERAGVLRCPDGAVGSLTMIGTVSPAGGNFEEPVTQSTLSTVKAFLGLSADRAYKRFYPSVDPLSSWSRYLDQLEAWYADHLRPSWVDDVRGLVDLLERGESVDQMMQVTGEEGVTLEDFVDYQKARLVDMVYLQQDAFDPVDVSMPLDRQVESLDLLLDLVRRDWSFEDKDAARQVFTRLTALYKNLNYAERQSADHARLTDEIRDLAAHHGA